MEATALSIGKSALSGALSYAKSAVAEEVALQLGVQRDKAFVTDELEMMQSFLMVAHDEQGEHNKVVRTWVKQVRDVAYDVEDGLQDFFVRVHRKSWWRIPRTLLNRRHVAKQMKELRAKVEDVSQRNVRYRLIDRGSKPANSSDLTTTAAAMFGVDEATRHGTDQHQSGSRLDLAQLILSDKKDLGSDQIGVIGVWGTSGIVGHSSIILGAYENPSVKLNFPCRAWLRVTRPFHRKEFVQSIVEQFRVSTIGVVDFLLEPEGEKTSHELSREYNGYVSKKRYLIVLTELSTLEEWHQIKTCFPENKLGSRIIVSSEHVEVASLCSGQESIASELKQLSSSQTIYAFYQQNSQDDTYSSKPTSSSKLHYIDENEIQEVQCNVDVDRKMVVQERLARTNTMAGVLEEFQLIGREKEKLDIIKLIGEQASTQQFQVIGVWGMGGLGKTTLIKDIYQNHGVTGMFERHAFVTVLRPFKLHSLIYQLVATKSIQDFAGDTKKDIASMGVEELNGVLGMLSEGKKCLIVLDDFSSTTEWDKMVPSLLSMNVIVITTRREDIAKHCCKKLECMQRPAQSPSFSESKQKECIYLPSGLRDEDACDVFIKKVFKDKTTNLAKHYPELVEPANMILKKCNGLPLAIVSIGGFLADQPTKTVVEWRKLNERMSAELEMNPKFETIYTVLMQSYDGLPYYLKSCFLYISIFPEDHNVSRRRLVERWIAEGYSKDISVADKYFVELIERSMILPTQQSVCSIQGFDSCQLHDLIRDISIAKSMEENLVFRLEEGCSSNTHGAFRHLAISSNWEGDERELESTVELSRIRSVTVFGKWMPFYISEKMRFLRVLDLEDTEGLADRHLEHIGKHLHLRYLSLRGCHNISYLPDSMGNLRQLETLDIRGTRILILPKTITNLSKLHFLHASNISQDPVDWPALPCVPYRMHVNCHRGACAPFSCYVIDEVHSFAVNVPRGIGKLKTLHTLDRVHLAWGNEIKGLTSLRKLGVVLGINTKIGLDVCSAISALSRLESLSVESQEGNLYDHLHGMSSPLENLQSLKLSGYLKKMPEWIQRLQNLTKLDLTLTKLSGDGETIQVLGNLPNLSILHIMEESCQTNGPITFHGGLFRSLEVLELSYLIMEISLEFEATSMPKLEVLSLYLLESTADLSGLKFLPSIKEVRLSVNVLFYENMTKEEVEKEAKRREDKAKEDITKQLAANQNGNRPILKVD
ncbi:hypothetical protein CFC21_090466 [Triticum aestivum]|uniref:Uncharacterized protein n=2 Tax=Triticum aestivum TaxID=4565 RepID=A0A3B6PT79_WHEAT|nr:disease resistance protein Pik-2-like [Triticum aestivum]KAF7087270.1 hypothetical protein CFC21_090466 [Triticum aestivum]